MNNIARRLLLCGVAFVIIALFSGCSNDGMTYQVNDVASDLGAFTIPLNIVGIVNVYSSTDADIVGIMDKKELQCTTPNCEKKLLAVRFEGERPKIGAEIKVYGSVVGEKLFQAETLEVLANHNLGGQ